MLLRPRKNLPAIGSLCCLTAFFCSSTAFSYASEIVVQDPVVKQQLQMLAELNADLEQERQAMQASKQRLQLYLNQIKDLDQKLVELDKRISRTRKSYSLAEEP